MKIPIVQNYLKLLKNKLQNSFEKLHNSYITCSIPVVNISISPHSQKVLAA